MATEVDTTEELARLRTTLTEILQTKKTLQAKLEAALTELATSQADNATLKTQVAEATQKVSDLTVGVPLKRLAAQLSEFPDLWLSEFTKRYSVEADSEGNLAILTKDGKPAKDANGKPVEFAANPIWKLLTGGSGTYAKSEDAKLFATLTKWHGASGGGSGSTNRGSGHNSGLEEKKPKAPKMASGLLGLH
jgi:hypothetical protein